MAITLKEAKELSILKWKWLAQTGYDHDRMNEHPQHKILSELEGYCGFCQLQSEINIGDNNGCGKCILFYSKGCCNGLWLQHVYSLDSNKRKQIASQILKLIKKVKID